ncbi:MAG: tRNA (adenosine(37)-N6)-threonylcarbamoyltransferase complex ATPase subunit type 1 TsaE [Saprospiraceae bacterium]
MQLGIPAMLEALNGRRKLALYGDLGAGKTTFVQAFCRHLGVEGHTSSPTFSLINVYRYATPEGHSLVHHLDLYRLKNLEEALDIGVEDVLYDPWYCFVEWPEVIEPVFPADGAKIHLEILHESLRRVLIL